ncbi:MAG: acyl-CoA dehydrogenase family protein, partial [Anaerolineae bacterium]
MTLHAQSIMATARSLADAVASRAAEADRQGAMPPEDASDLMESGFLRMVVPAEYGGLDLPMADCIAAHLELAKASASTALVAGMTIQFFGYEREQRSWPQAMYARLCRAVAEGALINSVASEPNMGSPSRGAFYETNAVLTDDGWLINGHKQWITGGRHLTHMLVKLSIGEEDATILVPADAKGLDWHETWCESLSLRASNSHDLYLNDVLVPEENLVTRGTVPKKGP